MANTVTLLSYANTFGDWVVATNKLAQENNDLAANSYVKSSGTLFLNSPTLGLQVANNAVVQGQFQVSGIGSSAYIQKNLQVDGSIIGAGNNYITANDSNPAFTITQSGSGLVIKISDQAGLDPSPTVIDSNGNVYIGSAITGPNKLNVANGNVNFANNLTVGQNITSQIVRITNHVVSKDVTASANILGATLQANTRVISPSISVSGTGFLNFVQANSAVNTENLTVTTSAIVNNLRANSYVNAPLVVGTTNIIGDVVSGNTRVITPTVIGTTEVIGDVVSGNTRVIAPVVIGTTSITGTIVTGNTHVNAPRIVGATDVIGGVVSANSRVIAPTIIGTTNVISDIISANTHVVAPRIVGATDVIGNIVSANTHVIAPRLVGATDIISSIVSANTNVTAPRVVGATDVIGGVISSNTRVVTPSVISTSNIITDIVSANTHVIAPTIIGTSNVISGVISANTNVTAPRVVGATDVIGNIVSANAHVVAPTVIGTSNVISNIVSANAHVVAPTIIGTSNVISSIISANTHVTAPRLVGGTNIIGGIISANTHVVAPTIVGSTNVVSEIVSANAHVIAPTIIGTSNVISSIISANAHVIAPTIIGTSNVISDIISANTHVVTPTVIGTNNVISGVISANTNVTAPRVIGATEVIGANVTANAYVTATSLRVTSNVDANLAIIYADKFYANSATITGNFVIEGETVYTSDTLTLNDGAVVNQNAFFVSARVGANVANAMIRWYEPLDYWDIRDVNNPTSFSRILTANLISDSLSNTSSDTVASSRAANNLNVFVNAAFGKANAEGAINSTQNTWITNTDTLARAAFGQANTANVTRGISLSNTADYYPVFVDSNNAVATSEVLYTRDSLSYNPFTGRLTSSIIEGSSFIQSPGALFSSSVELTGDDDYFEWGAGNDVRMMYNGTANTMNLQLYSDVISFKIVDNANTADRFVFYKANGDLQLRSGGILFPDGTRQRSDASGNTIALQAQMTTTNTNITSVNTLAGAAYAQANNASGNTVALQAISNLQNTNITSVNTLATAAFGKANAEGTINTTQNTWITNTNTFAQFAANAANAGIALANAAYGKANAEGSINDTQNTNITNVNTLATAAYGKANAEGTINTTQNTWITNTDTLARAAFGQANTANGALVTRGIGPVFGTYYPIFVDSNNAIANAESLLTRADLNYNPLTGVFGSEKFVATGYIQGSTGIFDSVSLSDNDHIEWGGSNDVRMMYNGTANTINLQMYSDAISFKIVDNANTADRFIFYKANGDLRLVSGNVIFSDGTVQRTEALTAAQAAFASANSAATVNSIQDGNISSSNIFAHMVSFTANIARTTANSSLDLAQASYAQSNAQTTINATQNTWIINTDTKANAAFFKANTVVSSYDLSVASFAKANAEGLINVTQNSWIAAVNTFAQAAFNTANTGGGASGNTIALQAQMTTTNTNIIAVNTFTQSAYNKANSGPTITNDTTSDNTIFVLLSTLQSGSLSIANTSSSKLTYNPSSGTLSATIFNSTSDENKKENVETITNAISTVEQLRGVSYNWKDNGKRSMGLIAQEVEKVLPELVSETEEGKSISYQNMIGLLVEAIKELKAEINELKKGK